MPQEHLTMQVRRAASARRRIVIIAAAQLIQTMQALFRDAALDLPLTTYSILATGADCGVIGCVPDAGASRDARRHSADVARRCSLARHAASPARLDVAIGILCASLWRRRRGVVWRSARQLCALQRRVLDRRLHSPDQGPTQRQPLACRRRPVRSGRGCRTLLTWHVQIVSYRLWLCLGSNGSV